MAFFAKGYSRAASALAEQILDRPQFSDYEAYPVVFLYRQAFELYLKGLYYRASLVFFFKDAQGVDCRFINKHPLKPLADTLQKICKSLFPMDQSLLHLAQKVFDYANEFDQIDKDSFGYRYPIDTHGNHSTNQNQIVNLLALHNSMKQLLSELEVIDFGFDITAYQSQEVYEIIHDSQIIITSENYNAS